MLPFVNTRHRVDMGLCADRVLDDAVKNFTSLTQVVTGTPEEFGAFLADSVDKWRRVVKATGAKPG